MDKLRGHSKKSFLVARDLWSGIYKSVNGVGQVLSVLPFV